MKMRRLKIREKIKTLYHLLMAANKDEKTQNKGMLVVIVNIGRNRAVNFVTNGGTGNVEHAFMSPFLHSSLLC
jgi:hypothetical protein